jgi:hypothetical protein
VLVIQVCRMLAILQILGLPSNPRMQRIRLVETRMVASLLVFSLQRQLVVPRARGRRKKVQRKEGQRLQRVQMKTQLERKVPSGVAREQKGHKQELRFHSGRRAVGSSR